MASSSQNTGGASEGSIPIVFTWTHGGRHVYIAGSFTRWTLVRMIPRQGFPLVYQRVCYLSPRYHQYKFYVDGDYQHDVDQPSSSNGSEIVNTILLSGSRVTTQETLFSAPVIELDKRPRGDSGDVNMSKDISLSRILEFMSTYTTFNMMPSSGKVVLLDIDLQMKDAFDILYETGTTVAPVWDSSRGMIVRMLDPLDFMLTLLELENRCSYQIEESHRTISAWKEQKLQMEVHGHKRVLARGLISAGPDDSLAVVVSKILQNNVACY